MTLKEKGKVNIRGVNHYYEWIRQPLQNHNPKPVMVFIHGWGGSCRYWRTTAKAIANDYDCLLYDMRGFGQSKENKAINIGYELEDYAQDLLILLDTLNIDKIYFNAHSMGASIGLILLNLVPERIYKAILTCNGIFSYNALAFSTFHQVGGYVVKFRYNWFLKVPFADKMFMARFLYQPIPKDMSIAFLEDFLLADYNAALNTIYSSVSKKAVDIMPQEFAKIKVKTLLISGEKDQIIPASMGKAAAVLNTDNIDYVEIPKTGHFPMLEDENNYLTTIQNFLHN
ncbi:possible alpha/beta hydrolase superfamily [Geminocystis sp. NIES-3708]|uniref:alpha/beta fold hydrolase n=1 Tax=Geminocystis sp. NIES-3708 TaxID=1615909 RepID=UPI0005FC5851|nr:alpha/beta hydrolase [Geminocystis sp. NIES-3708]BAQ62276.1 possible alpha/beta hydrolase superfamily [Geminocystis sp. NIES-3708]